MEIINTRDDLDSATPQERAMVLRQLWAASINTAGQRSDNVPFSYTWSELDALHGGEPPLPPLPEVPVPDPVKVITALQGEMALHAAGMADQYQQFVEALPFLERSIWMRQTHWRIDDPLTQKGRDALGISDEQMQGLFEAAALIK